MEENNDEKNLNQEPEIEQNTIPEDNATNVEEENVAQNEDTVQENEETLIESEEMPAKSGKSIIIIVAILILLLIVGGITAYYLMSNKNEQPKPNNVEPVNPPKNEEENDDKEKENNENYSDYRISNNSIENFDLKFLELENSKSNKIYSPLSIKYALAMLKEGASGETYKQIAGIVGDYVPKKYPNNNNMSFANALFVKDTYKKFIKDTYVNALTQNYNAEVVYDSFSSPTKINNWISNKTFKLINNLLNDITDKDFILVNALAIDMEWVNKIQDEEMNWSVYYTHEDYFKNIDALGGYEQGDFKSLKFKDSPNVAAVELGAVVNKYDLVNVMGEENVRKTVGDAYQKWLDEGAPNSCYEFDDEKDPDRDTFVNNYIKDINANYKRLDNSTDFYFYVDENVKIFAKDLKKYSDTTLEYIAIMPTKEELNDFIKNNNASKINALISKIKPLTLDSFKDGVISEITGFIPMFKFDYQLDLMKDLKELGITDVFDISKADLSKLTSNKSSITDALHKSNIEFSNSGIKAAAVTMMGGAGAGDCGFDYIFKIPENRIEKIDLTFDRPYLFLILDKDTSEVWFTGTVYEPAEYEAYKNSIKMVEDWDS